MVHLVGFTIEIYYDARPYERQKTFLNNQFWFFSNSTSATTLVYAGLNWTVIIVAI